MFPTAILLASMAQAPCPNGVCPRVQQVAQAIHVNNPPAAPQVIPQQMPARQPVRGFLKRLFSRFRS